MSIHNMFMKKYAGMHRDYGVKIYAKDKKFKYVWKVLDVLLKVITLGKLNSFYDKYKTTVGNMLFLRAGWQIENVTDSDYITLCHESKHVEQCYRLGCGNIVVGTVLMILLYLLVPLPIFLAWFRYKWEREAYVVSIRAARKLGGTPDIEHYVKRLTGLPYLWAWVFKKSVRKWLTENC